MINKPLSKFITKKSREINFYPSSIDLFTEIFDFYRRLVHEDTYINRTEMQSCKEEKQKFQKKIEEIKSGNSFSIWAVYQNKIIASAHIAGQTGRSKHIGEIGLMVDKDFRGEGIGEFLSNFIIKKAKEMKLRLLVLETFAENKNAISLYKKMGFRKFGYLEKALLYKNKYSDKIDMFKEL